MRHGYQVVAYCEDCRRVTRQTLALSDDDHMEYLVCRECGSESKWPVGSKGIGRVEEVTNGERLGDVVPR